MLGKLWFCTKTQVNSTKKYANTIFYFLLKRKWYFCRRSNIFAWVKKICRRNQRVKFRYHYMACNMIHSMCHMSVAENLIFSLGGWWVYYVCAQIWSHIGRNCNIPIQLLICYCGHIILLVYAHVRHGDRILWSAIEHPILSDSVL